MYYKNFEAKISNIPEIVDYIGDALKKYKIPQKEIAKKLLIVEEVLVKMLNSCEKDTKVSIRVNKFLCGVDIKLLCEGKEFSQDELEASFNFESELSSDEVLLVKDLFRSLTRDKVQLVNKRGINICTIIVNESEYKSICSSFLAIAIGIVIGLLCKFIFSESTASFLCDKVILTIYAILLKGLRMIVPPLVFFAIACNIGKAGASKSFAKNIKKMIAFGFFTSCACILIGLVVTKIIPFNVNVVNDIAQNNINSNLISISQTSIADTLISIIPNNFFDPIINGNMLQLIFVAVLIGFGVSLATKYSMEANNALEFLYELFLKITEFITKYIVLLVFSSIALLVYKTNIHIFVSYVSCILIFYIAILLAFLVLLILYDLFTKENPNKFFKQFFSIIAVATKTCSTTSVIPSILETFDRKTKIPSRLYSILVPMGLFLCKSGTITFLSVFIFIGAKIFGIEVNLNFVLLAMFLIFVFSFTAPPIPYGAAIVTTSLFPMFGIPITFTSYILGIYVLLDFGINFLDTYAECISACIVAKTDIDLIRFEEKEKEK